MLLKVKKVKIYEDKKAQKYSNAINIANVKPLTVSSNDMNIIPPDYDYNIISNNNFYNI